MKVLAVGLFVLVVMASVNMKTTAAHIRDAIRAGQLPIFGVNLGGWLVAEHWINPDDALWKGVPSSAFSGGEYTTMKFLGHQVGDSRFRTHWATFITEHDIATISSYSLNTVRVPVGWWIVGYDNNDPSNKQEWKTFAPGGLFYLDRLINEWAVKYNVAVLVDIHAAKGSQNGNDHSAPTNPRNIYWDRYRENIDNTVEVARFLAARYRNAPAFLGLQLLNEPTNVDVNKLKAYYQTAHDVIRRTGNECILVTAPILWEQNAGTSNKWENFMRQPNVWHDWHKYLIWGYDGKTAHWIMNEGVKRVASEINSWTGAPLLNGEWCLASPGSAVFTDTTLRKYAKNYITAINAMKGGWTFWTWKQGNGNPRPNGGGGWCMRDLLRDCIINPKLWDKTSKKCP